MESVPHVADLNKKTFYSDFLHKSRPVILDSFTKDWPALSKWNTSYLKDVLGDKVVEVNMCNFENMRAIKKMKFSEYIDSINSLKPETKEKPYLRNLAFDEFPELKKDVKNASLFDENEHNLVIYGAFIGLPDTETLLHKDTGDNLLAMISGKKFIILVSPDEDDQLDNTHLSIPVNISDPNLTQHPLYRKVKHPMCFQLKKGEVLFIPRGWSHYVKNLEESISVGSWAKYVPSDP